ncbi:MAG: phosphoribosylanthranilate isomerase [Gemmatimonadaceae bacterium]
MPAEVKICGLMRPVDAAVAAQAGARYLGVVLAPSQRQLQPLQARDVLDGDTARVSTRVGVCALTDPTQLAAAAHAADLDVLQLIHPLDHAEWQAVRESFSGEIWGVVRLAPDRDTASGWAAWEQADAIVLDAFAPNALGGTGTAFDWSWAARTVESLRVGKRLVVAGGLTPDNVGQAIDTLVPDVVDVSSGVERVVGEKSAERIAAFMQAATGRKSGQEKRP